MGNAKSMTGYGRSSFSVGTTHFTVEISSVNQRGLSTSISTVPEWMCEAERIFFPLVKKYVARGKVHISVRPEDSIEMRKNFSWDEEATKTAINALKSSAKKLGITFEVDAKLYLRIAEICKKSVASVPSLEDKKLSAKVCTAVESALRELDNTRKREGEFLRKSLLSTLKHLKKLTSKIQRLSKDTIKNYKDALLERLDKLGLKIDLEDERLVRELAIFADRCDISEELTRLASHFEQFENILEKEYECGRKLDFFCTEILRELNTIGSKVRNAEVTRCVVEAKNEQEKLREQVQNLE